MQYFTASVHKKDRYSGIRWNSFGKEWDIKDPIVSYRDKNLTTLKRFKTPFIYKPRERV